VTRTLILALAAGSFVALGASSASALTYCENQATIYANHHASPVKAATVPTIAGALTGLAISSLTGNKHTGLAVLAGGAAGAAIGLAKNQPGWQDAYDEAYDRCRSGTVRKVKYYTLPPVGSEEWLDRCDDKYNSFDRRTGYFTKYDNTPAVCQLP
jgi:hypothetical protein